jgi:hypothetical protein
MQAALYIYMELHNNNSFERYLYTLPFELLAQMQGLYSGLQYSHLLEVVPGQQLDLKIQYLCLLIAQRSVLNGSLGESGIFSFVLVPES